MSLTLRYNYYVTDNVTEDEGHFERGIIFTWKRIKSEDGFRELMTITPSGN